MFLQEVLYLVQSCKHKLSIPHVNLTLLPILKTGLTDSHGRSLGRACNHAGTPSELLHPQDHRCYDFVSILYRKRRKFENLTELP